MGAQAAGAGPGPAPPWASAPQLAPQHPGGDTGRGAGGGSSPLTFCARAKEAASVTAGLVLGMAHTMVTPPARAAAVPDAKSSLWVPPGSRRWTWTSIRPGEQGSVRTPPQRREMSHNPRAPDLAPSAPCGPVHLPGRRMSFWDVMQSTCIFSGGAALIWPSACGDGAVRPDPSHGGVWGQSSATGPG